ncbi:MAG: hypothetical protein AB7D96_05440 [Arcobacteraceae bacterium]
MKQLTFLILMGSMFLFMGCSNELQNLQQTIGSSLGEKEQKEIIYTTDENIKLDTRILKNFEVEKSWSRSISEDLFDDDTKYTKYKYKKYLIHDKLFEVKYEGNLRETALTLYDYAENKKVLDFDNRYYVYIFDDTDINDKLYFGLKKIYSGSILYDRIDKLYSFDGKELREVRKDIKEKSRYLGNMRIISHVDYINKYIVYTIQTKNYNRYKIVNVFNDKEVDFKATVLGFKDNKALLYKSLGSMLFGTLQYQLSVLNLDTQEEEILLIDNYGKNSLLRFYESKSQLIVSLPNGKNIDIVSLKNVIGDLSKIERLQADIYNIDEVSSREYEMSLQQIGHSIDTSFDDTRPFLYK